MTQRMPAVGWVALLLATSPAHAQRWDPGGAHAAIRGITIGPIESSQQPGRGYGTDYTAALLDELVRLGANSISITPFGRIWSLRSTSIRMDFEWPYERNRQGIRRLVAQAK